jgi:hypothetical protein
MKSKSIVFIAGDFDLNNDSNASTVRLKALIDVLSEDLKFKIVVSGSNDSFKSLFIKILDLTSSKAVSVYIYGDRFFPNILIVIIGKIFRWKLVYDFVEYRKYRLHYIRIRKKFLVLLSNYLIPKFSDKVILLGKAPNFISQSQILYQPIYPVKFSPKEVKLKNVHKDLKKKIIYNGDFDSKEDLELMRIFLRNMPKELFIFSFVTKRKRIDVLHVSLFFESYATDFIYECPIEYRNEVLRAHHYVLLFRGNNEENRYSFPTRVVDFMKQGLVVVTNNCQEMKNFFCDSECIYYSSDFSLDDYFKLSNNVYFLQHRRESLNKLTSLKAELLLNYLE